MSLTGRGSILVGGLCPAIALGPRQVPCTNSGHGWHAGKGSNLLRFGSEDLGKPPHFMVNLYTIFLIKIASLSCVQNNRFGSPFRHTQIYRAPCHLANRGMTMAQKWVLRCPSWKKATYQIIYIHINR